MNHRLPESEPTPAPAALPARRHRRPVAVLLLVVLALVASACGSSSSGGTASSSSSGGTEPAGAAADGSWTFTDSNGTTHRLDSVPETIAAQSIVAGGLWELGIVADGVFGPLRRPNGEPDASIGLAPPDAFASLGEVDSQINMEALAELQPDIIVAPMWENGDYWGIASENLELVRQIAPIVGIRIDHRPVSEPLGVVADLATSLGADVGSGGPAAARDAFESSSEGLRAALAANPDLRVGALSGTLTEMYVAYAPAFPDLRYFEELGMNLVEPETHETSGGFWETLSWEQAGKYPMDLVIIDARTGTVEEVLPLLPPTATSLPPIAAGQIASWKTTHALGYRNVAENLDALTVAVEAAEPLDR